jgi:hypothetical protein
MTALLTSRGVTSDWCRPIEPSCTPRQWPRLLRPRGARRSCSAGTSRASPAPGPASSPGPAPPPSPSDPTTPPVPRVGAAEPLLWRGAELHRDEFAWIWRQGFEDSEVLQYLSEENRWAPRQLPSAAEAHPHARSPRALPMHRHAAPALAVTLQAWRTHTPAHVGCIKLHAAYSRTRPAAQCRLP